MKHLKIGLIVLTGIITSMIGLKFLTYDYQTITTLPIIATTVVGIELLLIGVLTIIYSDILKPIDPNIKTTVFGDNKVDTTDIDKRTELFIIEANITDAKVALLNYDRKINDKIVALSELDKDISIRYKAINALETKRVESSAYRNPFPIITKDTNVLTRLKDSAERGRLAAEADKAKGKDEANLWFPTDIGDVDPNINKITDKDREEVRNRAIERNKYGFPDLDGVQEGEDDLKHFGIDRNDEEKGKK